MDDIIWANTWQQHLVDKAKYQDDGTAFHILELHGPDDRGNCQGCDADGYESEQPDWPCRTAEKIAGLLGAEPFRSDCSECGSLEIRQLPDGNRIGHRRHEGDMWVSCPGSPEQLEAYPWRSEAEVMAEFTEKLTSGLAAAADRMAQAQSAFGMPVSPVPPAYQLLQVKKWGTELKLRNDLFGA